MAEPRPWPEQPTYSRLIGYAEPWSVAPGERVRFMVSSDHRRYRAGIVRLRHGDDRPGAPGLKEEPVSTDVDGDYEGVARTYPAGSFVLVPGAPALQPQSFSLAAWIFPTRPGRGPQGLLTKWSEADESGYALVIDEAGALALRLGAIGSRPQVASTGTPLRAGYWYFVAAAFDSAAGTVRLIQRPYPAWPLDATAATREHAVPAGVLGASAASFVMGAWSLGTAGDPLATGGHFDGKIESPVLLGSALRPRDLDAVAEHGGAAGGAPIAAWDFARDTMTDVVRDPVGGFDGRTVNRPARAMTGHAFGGGERAWTLAPATHGALQFHADDLEDCRWPTSFELTVPAKMGSGIYAAKLTGGGGAFHIPFYVRPAGRRAAAPILFLAPTNSYLAYANFRETFATDKSVLGLYHLHADGSAVLYSSRRRPIVNHRPGSTFNILDVSGAPHQFNADLHLVDWLTEKGFAFDVATDEDLHRERTGLLSQYRVVLTGSHPEYWSGQMMDALQEYLGDGGRLMYLGGNGLIWATSFDRESGHYVEVRRGGGGIRSATAGERYHSTTGEFGGYWLERGRPPQRTLGVGSIAQGFDRSSPYQRSPASRDTRAAWIFDGVGDAPIGDFGLTMGGAAGFEIDNADPDRGTPPHALIVARATAFSPTYEHQNPIHVPGTDIDLSRPMSSDMVYFETPRGGAVFSVGSIAYCGSLSHNGYDNNVSRITENVLRRFASAGPLPEATAGSG
ncbi:MAG: LamG domain-containing protein [Chloroflexota bacterium]|nr:LamG domain-containing protein [Chloroflexota bacterium]